MRILFGDIETFNEEPIANGTPKYAETAELMVFTWTFDDEEHIRCWDRTADPETPAELLEAAQDPDCIWVFQNAFFDRTVLRLNHPELCPPIERWRCSMVKGMAHSLPGSLDKQGEIMGLAEDQKKLKEGKDLVRLFCCPQPKTYKLRRATQLTHPEKWARFLDYGKGDITPMRAIWKKLPSWNYGPTEIALWHLDQRINDRGIYVDQEFARAAVEVSERLKVALAKDTQEKTGFDAETGEGLESTTKRDKMLKYLLAECGVELPDLRASTLERRISDESLPEGLRQLLINRLAASTTSVTKYKKLLKAVSSDGRLRGLLQFDGATRTRRAAGRTFQPQNLVRPAEYLAHEWEEAIESIKNDSVDWLYSNPMEVLAGTMRGVIAAPKGKKLVVADLSNIEGRDQAWTADETWKLQAFRDFDAGIGPDLYKMAYGNMFNIDPADVTKPQRQIGKVAELACLAGDTLVLTDCGYIQLHDLTTKHKLWDGEQWITHKGIIKKGVRQTVNVEGIEVTPDHLILTNKTWMPAQELVLNESILCQALAIGSENLPSWESSSRRQVNRGQTWLSCNALVGHLLTWFTTITCEKALALDAGNALANNPIIGQKAITDTLISSRISTYGSACLEESTLVLTDAIIRKMQAIQVTGDAAYSFTNLGERIKERFCHTLLRSKDTIKKNWNWIGRTLTRGMNREICDSLVNEKTKIIEEKSKQCRKESRTLKQKIPVYDVYLSGPKNRFTVLSNRGPLIVHNCGYAGGVGAFVTFALGYNIDLDVLAEKALPTIPRRITEEAKDFMEWMRNKKKATIGLSEKAFIVCDSFKRLWREAHPNIAALWKMLDESARRAIHYPGVTVPCGMFKFRKDGAWLRLQLPSGRCLCYPGAKIDNDNNIIYLGVNQYTRKWGPIKTYSGKLYENICQSLARDVMFDNLPKIEAAGYEIILTVHDEVVCEAPNAPQFNPEHLSSLLAANHSWCPDLPLAATGFEGPRYKKD